jgi:hypothetical protein
MKKIMPGEKMQVESFCSIDLLWNDSINIRSIYIDRLLDDTNWLKHADALLDSANLIEPKVVAFWESWEKHKIDRTHEIISDKYVGIYLMLISFAIENFLKSVLVKNKRCEFQTMMGKNGRLPKELKTHKLVELAKALKFPIVQFRKEDILRRLTRHAVWAGRYPVSQNSNTLVMEKYSDDRKYLVTPFWKTDIAQIKELIKKIKDFADV